MAQLPGISAGDFITKCSHLLTAATGNSSPQILTLLNAALEGQICPWHSLGGSHPLSSYSGILSGEGAMCLRSRKGRGKPKRTSVVRCVRGSDSDNRLPESPVWCDVGGCSRGRVPRPAPGWLPRPCHGKGRPQAGSGAPPPVRTLLKLRGTWVTLITGKSSRLGCSPRHSGCPLPATSLPATGGFCTSGGAMAGKLQAGEPEAGGDSPSLGPGRAAGGPLLKVVPGRASPV